MKVIFYLKRGNKTGKWVVQLVLELCANVPNTM